MNAQVTEKKILPIIEDNQIADIVCDVLENLGYRINRANTRLRRITASEAKSEKIGRIIWTFDYRVTLEWDKISSGTQLTIGVRDNEQESNSTKCTERCTHLFQEIFRSLERAGETEISNKKDTRYGSAEWGTLDDLRKARYVASKIDCRQLLLSKIGNEYIALPVDVTPYHTIVCGATGTGKSTGFFVPNLVERLGCSMIVTEATSGTEKPDLFQKTSGWRKQAGHKIYWFNPVDNTSTRINPIDLVRNASEERTVERAESLADLIIQNTTRVGQYTDMWDKAEKFLLVSLILHAAATEKKFGHLGAIRWLLLKGSQKVYDVLSNSPSEIAASEFEGFVQNTSPNFRHGVVAGLLSRLNPWLTPQVIALTSTTDFDVNELQNELFTFYLSAPSRRSDLKTLAALTFNFLLDIVLQGKFKHPLALLLDEFTNFGYVNGMADALSIIRKTGISAVLGFQDYMQLEKVYERKDAEIIFSQPGTSIFFRPRKYKSAKSLSDALGMQTIKERQVLDTGKTHEFVTPRALMTPDELMSLDTDRVIVFTPNTKPVRLRKFSYVDYLAASQYEPPEGSEHLIDELIKRGGRDESERKTYNSRDDLGLEHRENHINFDQDTVYEREEDLTRTAPDPGDLFEV